MGDESYQVKQDEAVLFKGGHIQGAIRAHQSCGCPAPAPVQVARTTLRLRRPLFLPSCRRPAEPHWLPRWTNRRPVHAATLTSRWTRRLCFTATDVPPDMTAVVCSPEAGAHRSWCRCNRRCCRRASRRKSRPKKQTVAANSARKRAACSAKSVHSSHRSFTSSYGQLQDWRPSLKGTASGRPKVLRSRFSPARIGVVEKGFSPGGQG